MKQKLFLVLGLMFLFSIGFSQTKIIGKVLDQSNSPIVGATVQILGTDISTETDAQGSFELTLPKAGEYQLLITATGFIDYLTPVKLTENQVLDLGNIVMQPIVYNQDEAELEVSQDEISQEELGEENISGLLHGSRNVFLSAAAYNLGMLRFRVRGYDNRYNEVNINGMPMENMDNGRVYWSLWGGLNNVTRYRTSYLGLERNDLTFGNIAGSTNIDMFPSKFRKGYNVTYSLTNRTYRQRLMFTYSSGLLPSNWAFTVSASHRWSQEGYIPGTFYDAWAYYIGVEKQLKHHSLVFNLFGAPIRRGKAGATVQEVYDLVGSHYYNPYWGWQSGRKRNSRIAHSHIPVLLLTDVWNIDDNTKLTTTLTLRGGVNGATALNWYNAPDPRPDYYRYLPSYMTNPESAQIVADLFATDSSYNQINWSRLYDANRSSYEVIENANGIEGNTVSGYRAQYIVEDRRYDQREVALTSILNKTIKENLKVDGGFLARYYVTKDFKKLVDLLGADYWVDVDKYAERDFGSPDSAQNDLQIPNHIIKEGDVFGYKYDAVIVNSRTWAQALWSLPRVDLYGAGYLSYTSFWRYGYMKNGRFPDNSLGKSRVNNFFNYGVKLGVTGKITGRHYVVVHAAYMTEAPTFMNSYVSPRTRNDVVDNLKSEKIMSVDGGYYLRAPRLKFDLTLYYTEFKDRTKVRSFYHDGYRAFVNYVLTGINTAHQGIELAMEAKISAAFTATAVGSFGYYRYTSRPLVTITVDNSSEVLAKDKEVYVKGFLVPGTPQTAASAGLRYNSSHYWFAGFNVNYVEDNYLDFNPERRTPEAVAYILPGTEQWNKIIMEQKLRGGVTADAYFVKSIKFKQYLAYFSISVNNIFNNQNIQTGGYEQLRFDTRTQDPDKFPPKYYYYYGRQYFINLSIRF